MTPVARPRAVLVDRRYKEARPSAQQRRRDEGIAGPAARARGHGVRPSSAYEELGHLLVEVDAPERGGACWLGCRINEGCDHEIR